MRFSIRRYLLATAFGHEAGVSQLRTGRRARDTAIHCEVMEAARGVFLRLT